MPFVYHKPSTSSNVRWLSARNKDYKIKLNTEEEYEYFKNYYHFSNAISSDAMNGLMLSKAHMEMIYQYRSFTQHYWDSWVKDRNKFYKWRREKKKLAQMTNQEMLAKITPEEFVRKIDWLYHEYGKNHTNSEEAIINWLKETQGGH